jgi:hypothetical protein
MPPSHVLSDLAVESLSGVHSISVEAAVLPRTMHAVRKEGI